MKRIPLLALSMALILPITDGVAEPKKNEIFGFGRKRDQISNALFPGDTGTAVSAPQTVSSTRERDSDSIFRGGKPKKVESSAYLIQDGEKIEQPISKSKTKPSLFSKFKREPVQDDPVLTATNGAVEEVEKKSNSIFPPIPLTKEKVEAPTVTAPTPSVEELTTSEETAAPTLASAPEEEVMEEKKSGKGFFSFFTRDKKEEIPDATLTPVPVAITTTSEAETAPVAVSEKPEPAPTVVKEDASTPEVPQFAGTPEPEEKVKEKKGFSIPNPIAALKPDPKPVSLVGAETIIENGEIVGEKEDIVDANIVKTGDGKKDPPRIIDGVKTYDSWEDVEGRNVSAADRIISQIKSQ